jgi:CheY-like chemotaxis protein
VSDKKPFRMPARRPTPPPNREDPEVREFLDELGAEVPTPREPKPIGPTPTATSKTVAMPAVKQAELVDASKLEEKPRPVILIVDDDLAICEVLGELLEENGFAAEFAHDGRVAVNRMHELRANGRCPVLVLLDITMPEYTGFSYMAFANRCWMSGVPFRLISGKPLSAEGDARDLRRIFIEDYRRRGFDLFRKPFGDTGKMIEAIRDAIEKGVGDDDRRED